MLAFGGQISCSSGTSFQLAGKFGFCLDSFLASFLLAVGITTMLRRLGEMRDKRLHLKSGPEVSGENALVRRLGAAAWYILRELLLSSACPKDIQRETVGDKGLKRQRSERRTAEICRDDKPHRG